MKIGTILIVFSLLGIVAVSQNMDRIRSLMSRAATLNAGISILPSTNTLPPDRNFQVWVSPTLASTDAGIGFARVSVIFDQTKLTLTSDPVFNAAGFNKISATAMAEANSTGKIVMVAGLDTSQINNAPKTSFQLATLAFSAKISTPNTTTALQVNLNDSQIADLNVNALTLSGTDANLTLNPVAATATPTRTSTATPTKPQATATQVVPTATNIPTATKTPTLTPTAKPTTGGGGILNATATPTRLPTATPLPPTNTPTKLPTSTATPVVPSSTLMPTPTGVVTGDTTEPNISTTFLWRAYAGRMYLSFVNVIDLNKDDTLSLRVTDLPPGLGLGRCSQRSTTGATYLTCIVSGYPTTSGTYYPKFTAIDARRNTTTKSLTLHVAERKKFLGLF